MLYIIVIAIILYLLYIFFQHREFYTNILFIKDTTRQNVIINNNDFDSTLKDFIKRIQPKYFLTSNVYSPDNDELIYDDIIGYELSMSKTSTIVACTGDKKMICFIQNPTSIGSNHISVLVDKKIGYMHPKDIVIIKSIFFCYDLKIEDKNLQKYDTYDSAIKDLTNNDIASIFLYTNHKNPLFQDSFSDMKLGLYQFEDIDLIKTRFILPNASVRNYDFSLSFKKYIDKFPVKFTLAFDNIIYCPSNEYNYLFDYIIMYFEDNYEFINYYAQKFKIHPRTAKLLYGKTQSIIDKRKKTILEQFIQKDENEGVLNINFDTNLPGFYDTNKTIFEYDDLQISEIPLKLGDTINLLKQDRAIENGEYKVIDIDYNISKCLLKRLTQLQQLTPKDDAEDSRYICVTDRNIKQKELCKSAFDVAGNPKKYKKEDVWDRPCDTDLECPFFQKNVSYKNYRGGCNGGFCEMPLGVKPMGFRQYEGTPICHGCGDKLNRECCSTQKQPDYAFSLDEYERLPQYIEEFDDINTPNNTQDKTDTTPQYKDIVKDSYLIGDFNEVSDKNVYHYELPNEELLAILKVLIDSVHTPNEEPLDINLFLTSIINDTFVESEKNDVGELFTIYNIEIKSKELNDDNTIARSLVFATMFREGKSHGKRFSIKLWENIQTGQVTIKDISILGIIPAEKIIDNDQPKGITEVIYTKNLLNLSDVEFKGISDDDIFKPSQTKEYICNKAKKWNEEFNMSVDCTSI